MYQFMDVVRNGIRDNCGKYNIIFKTDTIVVYDLSDCYNCYNYSTEDGYFHTRWSNLV